jgi:hypothetical protein
MWRFRTGNGHGADFTPPGPPEFRGRSYYLVSFSISLPTLNYQVPTNILLRKAAPSGA